METAARGALVGRIKWVHRWRQIKQSASGHSGEWDDGFYVVTWPDGRVDRLDDVPADERAKLMEMQNGERNY